MKRDILCTDCDKPGPGISKDSDPFLVAQSMTEQIVGKRGTTLDSFVCDLCGTPLPKGSRACARSIIGIGGRYFEWEHEYLDLETTR